MNDAQSLQALRVAGRLSVGFILELVKAGGHRRDVIDAVLRAAIAHANQAHIIADPDLQRRYAALDEDPPDTLRRPATLNAMSASLGVPFETTRRRVGKLVEAGVCTPKGRGVIVPRTVTSSEPFRAAIAFQFEQLRLLYGRLRALGLLEGLAARPAVWTGEAPPLRLAGRLVVGFVLRFNETVSARLPDVVTSLVLMEMLLANTEHLPDSERGTEAPGAEGFVPDVLRRPVATGVLAERLGIAPETLRRHVLRLADQGLCAPRDGGWLVPAATLAGPGFMAVMGETHRHLVRLFTGLADFGVLAAWEREARGSIA